MSRRTKAWMVALVALLALSLGIGRAVLGKRASAAAAAVAASAPAQAVELTAADLASVRRADLRSTLEKTVRQQASSIYQKAGVSGRHAFAAWFLEDYL